MRDFAPDTFTENDVKLELERKGLKYYDKGRYILAQCPMHEDAHPSVQIYKDDWFVNCHAGCGRFHITKAFPELRQATQKPLRAAGNSRQERSVESENKKMNEKKYKTFDLMEDWLKMELLPPFELHGVPSDVLNEMGWRKFNHSIFIPYFSASKESIPFAQYRHLQGDVRFTMLKDARPTMYGTWNLDNHKLFLVEGASDAAVLEYAMIPWIAAPSAASDVLVRLLAAYCKQNDIELVFAGDNDLAGLKLRQAIDSVMPYRVKQAPEPYKDWGEFLENTDLDTVQDYAFEELFGKKLPDSLQVGGVREWLDAEDVKIAGEVEAVDPFPVSKEPLNEPTKLVF